MKFFTAIQSENSAQSGKILQAKKRRNLIPFLFAITLIMIPSQGKGMISGDEGEVSGDIFGRGGGYVHPFLMVSDNYTDNVYYDPDHGQSDYYTIFSPGILFMIPGSKVEDSGANILSIATPGGLMFSKDMEALETRFHARLLYSADIEDYHSFDNNDVTTANLEGGFQYNLKGGLSLDVLHQRNTSYKARSEADQEGLSQYAVQLTSVILFYALSEKTDFRMDYRLFDIEYDDDSDRDNDRKDSVISGYASYRFTPKTSFYAGCDYIDINYDQSGVKNSAEFNYSSGVRWLISDKTNGRIALGYGIKDFQEESADDSRTLIVQAFLNNRLTAKSYLNFAGLRRTNETDTEDGQYIYTNRIMGSYFFRMSEQIVVMLKLSYTDDQYKGGFLGAREDKTYGISPHVGYIFKKWLEFGLSYGFDLRESNQEGFGYTQNGVSMEIRAVL